MGVLDDAIREHLELKRKHGAAEDEVRRKEQEALGPPQRQPVEAGGESGGEPQAAPEAPASAEAAPPTEILQPAEPADAPAAPAEESAEPDWDFEAAPEPAADEPQPPGEGADEDAGEEDVLEETPDFLQETPEHDRLWFEQKPPRDFDFDE